MTSEKVATKLNKLPVLPGIYLFKDKKGRIIYVGKAAVLRNRVRQYFQPASVQKHDTKTQQLIHNIAALDWIETESEIDALFLESELIKRYKPKYNIDLRDDKHYEYVRVDLKSDHPTVKLVRRPMDDNAEYVGPFVHGIRQALKLLRKVFPYDISADRGMRSKLLSDIGLSPGLSDGVTTLSEYRKNLKRLISYLKGNHRRLEKELEKEMKRAAEDQAYERAARLRNQIESLKRLRSQVIFGDKERFDVRKDQALGGIARILGIPPPRRIEGYDISHLQGTNTVASMVVFTDGISDKKEYRKFRSRIPGNDDFAHMREVISRRFSGRNLQNWAKPDLILIDGGKGQLAAALEVMRELNVDIPAVGLAKRFEEIIMPKNEVQQGQTLQRGKRKTSSTSSDANVGRFEVFRLPHDSPIVQLLQRVRDESHRFAVNYQTILRGKQQVASILEDVPGVGPATRKKLTQTFGGIRGVKAASLHELAEVVGESKARAIKDHL